MNKFLDVHGVGVEISGDSVLVGWIAEDFAFFERQSLLAPAQIVITVGPRLSSRPSTRFPAFKTQMCRASGWRHERICDYGAGTFVVSRVEGKGRGRQRKIEVAIDPEDRDLGYEALYSAALSAIGEELDRKGFHRVHALGIEAGGKRALVVLSTGAGKSAIAALLAREEGVKIFSDETPLLRRGKMYPFPLRGALRPEAARALDVSGDRVFRRKVFPEKVLFSLPRARIAVEAAPVDWVLVGRTGAREPGIEVSRFASARSLLALIDSSVVGRGVAQMAEYMIRADSAWVLPKIALRRLQTAAGCLGRARSGVMRVSNDARENARVLSDFLRDRSGCW